MPVSTIAAAAGTWRRHAVIFDARNEEKRHDGLKDRDLSGPRERRTITVMRHSAAAARDCPLAPPSQASVYSRALHRACLVLGGLGALARRLEVPEAELRRWIQGEAPPPEHAFLEAVEVILLDAGGQGRAN